MVICQIRISTIKILIFIIIIIMQGVKKIILTRKDHMNYMTKHIA